MDVQSDPERFGPYQLVRRLRTAFDSDCWLALHDDQSSHMIYRFGVFRDKSERRRFVEAVSGVSALKHDHILPIEHYTLDDQGRGWLVTPFTGNQQGLVRLPALLEAKGGRLGPVEAERCITQLLEAYAYAHEMRRYHGPLSLEDVLVDPRGSVWIELFGLKRELEGLITGDAELVRDAVRSVVEIGYRLLTGLSPEEPRIAAGRLVRRLDKRWDEWFERGLEPHAGFASADEAMRALPSAPREAGVDLPKPVVKGVFGRLRAGSERR